MSKFEKMESKNPKNYIFELSKSLQIKFLCPKMSKFEKLEPKNPKNLHFCAEKVTKIKNYVKCQSILL